MTAVPAAGAPAPQRVSLDALAWLLGAGMLRVHAASPFAFAAGRVPPPAPEGRAACEALSPGARAALALLAAPQHRVRIASSRSRIVLEVYTRDGKACPFSFARDGFSVGPVGDVAALRAWLTGRLAGGDGLPADGGWRLWPSTLVSLTRAWPMSGRALDVAIPAGELPAALHEDGLVVEDGGAVRLGDGARPWLEAVWSGVVIEVEVVAAAESGLAEREALRLHAAGRPPRRVLSRRLTGFALWNELRRSGIEQREETLVQLVPATTSQVEAALRTLLPEEPRG